MPNRKYNYRTSLSCVFLIMAVIVNNQGFSQNQAPTELDIKTSGLYYYGQAIGDNEEIANLEAKQELVANIIFSSEDKFDSQLQTDILLQGVEFQYLVFPRGNRIRAIAYILKEQVIWDAKKETLKIGEAIFAEQKSQLSPPTDDQAGTQTSLPKNIPVEKVEPEDIIMNKDEEVRSMPYVEEGEENDTNNDSEKVLDAQIAKSSIPEIIRSESDLINFMQHSENIQKVAPVLTEMKVHGIIQFGNEQSMSTPNAYYLLYFDPNTGMLNGFLDKPKNGLRDDFINKTRIQDLSNYKNSKLIWILFF
ncbi:MAG TPA: hypothetical protein VFC92_10170 [Bacteroidales bacterium]|nr:hypothetical protein [Bacteroidales bacterium]